MNNHESTSASEEERLRKYLLPNLSTQLLTPVDTITTLARLLAENRDDNLTSQQLEWANVILLSGTDLQTLLKELLGLAQTA